ncbi:MAG: aminotransferase class I/II-fold pyridoxal phosphate-dependent enzyme [Lentisphaerae bacterium]|nr:aminotransferase class I/II-fold pyridoxal phosphate-dependent enzyme [Lentisphaerota bacterium]
MAVRPLALGPRFEWRMPASYQCSLFFLTNPNAPTGARYPKDKVRAFCRRMRGVIVLDEAYVDFADGDCLDLALASEHVLVLRSFSKSYSLAGLRAGYAIGSAALIEALLKIKDSYNTSRLTQAIALAAVRDQRTLRANVQRIRRTRGWLAAQLAALGFEVFPSETNFLWVRPPRLPALELFQQLVARRIFVRHFPGRRTAAYLRITVGTDQQAQLLMQALREVYGAP